jgi:hypothetical protein
MAIALTISLVVLLWVAAVAFGRDSREGSDWFSRTSVRDPSGRLGD